MSRTASIGIVGATYWSTTAYVMVRCLDRIINGQKTEMPLGIFRDAERFFKVVLSQKTGDIMFDNLPAQLHAHVTAWDILNTCPNLRSRTTKGADRHFLRFAGFLKSLADQPTVPLDKGWGKQIAVPLNKRNKEIATDLRDFFVALLRRTTG